jgi:hypothetical protein
MISISLSPALGCAYGRFDLTVIQRRLVNVWYFDIWLVTDLISD